MSSFRPLLIIEHNYNYPEPFEKLEILLKDRFPERVHLIPFYNGKEPHVFPVYEHSTYFERYFPQVIDKIYDSKYTHYVIIADDLMLNPALDAGNLNDYLKLDEESSFLPDPWGMVHELSFKWTNSFSAINSFYLHDLFFHHAPDWKKVFPPAEEAWKVFEKMGYKRGRIRLNWEKPNAAFPTCFSAIRYYIKQLIKRRRTPPYPLLTGYAEFFVIEAKAFPQFAKWCETAGQMRLWVEPALHTLLPLCSRKVVYEKDRGLHGITLWTPEENEALFKKHNGSVKSVASEFKPNTLYLHPVKLTKWQLN